MWLSALSPTLKNHKVRVWSLYFVEKPTLISLGVMNYAYGLSDIVSCFSLLIPWNTHIAYEVVLRMQLMVHMILAMESWFLWYSWITFPYLCHLSNSHLMNNWIPLWWMQGLSSFYHLKYISINPLVIFPELPSYSWVLSERDF